jgi:branched-chain amino acid transport system ATP-binding protein
MVASAACSKAGAVADSLLQTERLTKRFGGVLASDAITLDIAPNEVHAVIGPNGAGKTTLIGLLSGEISPLSGSIHFDGGDITRLPVYRRSQLGLARSFQITSLFRDFTALDNVALAVQAHCGHSFRFWRDARREDELRKPALVALDRVGLSERADVRVDKLSHGEHRQLEIAMALATAPRLLLLDEPMAGMGPEESARMVQMLRALKGSVTILLIEHDMEAVFALADRLTVLVYGRIIASGSPEAVRTDAAVRQAYLGEKESGGQHAHRDTHQGGRHG